tara:strand:+ start:722 stop:1267 length:546 start_codon:yes stop_codon:yes gene_type:complete
MRVISKPPLPPPPGHIGVFQSKSKSKSTNIKSVAPKSKSLPMSNVGFSGLNPKMVNSQYNKLKKSLNKYGGKKSRKNNRKFNKKNKLRKTYKRRKTNKRKPKTINKRKKNLTRRKRRGGTLEINLDNLALNKNSDRTNPFAKGVNTAEGRKNEIEKMERIRQAEIADQTKIAIEKMKKSQM